MPTITRRSLAALAIATAALFPAAASAQRGYTQPDDVAERKVDIYSEGTRLTGRVFTSKSVASIQKLPVIVMAQGWGGNQASLVRDASEFAQAGYYVLTFDYRGWGESDSRVVLTERMPNPTEGEFTANVRAVREVMDPMDMGMDWLNVLHWIHGEQQADVERIGIWGTSMGGGFAVYAAANDARVKAVHSQVTGVLDGRAMGTSEEAQTASMRRARGQIGYPQPREKYGNLNGAPIFARFVPYIPGETIVLNDKVALQIVLAENEEYGTNEGSKKVYDAHKGPKNLAIIPGIKHYDVYRGAREQAHALALAWFEKHLKGDM